jgi:DNA helicase-2/ATP-dependent DNA helicase PcrA
MTPLEASIDQLRKNASQWAAFEASDHCVVLAPPGSGKTKLLTTKLAHAFTSGAIRPPRGAACITMTNEAAKELGRRLASLGVSRRPNLVIGTVHGFALTKIVLPYAAAAGRPHLANSHLATPDQIRACFDDACDAVGFEGHERTNVFATMQRARQRLDLSGDVMLGGPRIADVARRTQLALEAASLYDFNDLVRHAVSLVEEHAFVRAALSATYQHLYVDEYQDLAPGLDRIVQAFVFAEDTATTLFAVGDPDQAIYAFSGARPQLLADLAVRVDVNTQYLLRNYRSGQSLVDTARRVLAVDHAIEAEHEGGTLQIHPSPGGEAAQADAVLRLVQGAIADGAALDQILIVAPWGKDRDRCADALRAASIPVFARSDDAWEPTPLTQLIEAMAAWVTNRDASGVTLGDILDGVRNLTRATEPHFRDKSVVRQMLDAQPDDEAGPFVEALSYVAERADGSGVSDEDAAQLRAMAHAVGPQGPASGLAIRDLGARARAPGHVLAATIHAAKGLEFDVVILAGADEGSVVGFNSTPEEVAEARRKFYVAITRARHRVHVVYTDRRISKRGNSYPVSPCRFLADLGTRDAI